MKVADIARAAQGRRRTAPAPLGASEVSGKKGWKGTTARVVETKKGGSLRARLQRADSQRTLIANNAAFARKVLEEFASISRPKYSAVYASVFGSFIDFFVMLRWPVGNTLTRALVRLGGPEQLRFLFCVATFDANHDGRIDDEEWARYEKLGDMLISDSVAMCGNMGIVGALLLGQTHLVSLGRPIPYELSEESAEAFDEWVLWLAYAFNVASEGGAFFTLCIAVITRNNLTNVRLRVSIPGPLGSRLGLSPALHLCSPQRSTVRDSPTADLADS